MQNAPLYSVSGKRSPKYHQLQQLWEEQKQLFKWGSEERILDAGCGPGDVTTTVVLTWLPPDFRLLLGVDISPSSVEHAMTYSASEKVMFSLLDIGGDISNFLTKEEISPGFTKVFSFYTLNWVPDLKRAVENLFNLLRSGGEMLLHFPVDRLFQKTYIEVRGKDPWKEYLKDRPRKIPQYLTRGDPSKEFKELLLGAGFEVVKCEMQDHSSKFDSIDDMKVLIESLNQDTDRIPVDLRRQFFQDCFEILEDMQVLKISNHGVILTQSVLLVVARKP